MMQFLQSEPTIDNYWRSIILFGRNTASYKFALAKALLEIGEKPGADLITLEDLAEPFSRHLCTHLSQVDKQGSRPVGQFLDACRSFNAGEITKDALLSATQKYGFKNVIDAFHVVNQGELAKRFFIDERQTSKGIRLTEHIYRLFDGSCPSSLTSETEARWRLVETAWELGISKNIISIHADNEEDVLFSQVSGRRINVTSSRDALNGYQKGKCFYCFTTITILPGFNTLADVDHFFPHILKKKRSETINIDGVWNLVLSCSDCNRGVQGKFARVPSLNLLQRLHKRNEYLISSHHPLRETLIQQTGKNLQERKEFLQKNHNWATECLHHLWEPKAQGSSLL